MAQLDRQNDHAWVSPAQYAVLLTQLALVSAAVYLFNIGRDQGMQLLLPLIFLGFAVHAWLPVRHRTTLFLLLSVLSICLVLGIVNGLLLLGIGMALFGICHLPFNYNVRVGLLLVCGALLITIRIDWFAPFDSVPMAGVILPILGSMFMFRLIIYIYDIRNETQPAPLSQRLSYFFMLPNVCFPLFPVIDYQGFIRDHYNAPAYATYQKGLRWILRGVVHLLIYRIVYYFWTPTFDEVHNLADVAQFVVSSYLIYLRVSGLFHIAIGILCLFGYNLPETHRLYFLASSFTDFWRRINIYWKDFVMKIFYFPLAMRLRKFGMTTAVVVASLVTLIISWLLHSYQTLWLLGKFPLIIQDAVFWTLLGVAVAINSVIEMKQGRTRATEQREPDFRSAFILSLKTAAMFCTMSLLWSFWTTPSVEEWFAVIDIASQAPVADVLAMLVIIAGAVLLGTAVQLRAKWDWVLTGEREPSFARAASVTAGLALVLVLAALPQAGSRLTGDNRDTWVTLTNPQQLNQRDRENQTRGYYEELLTVDEKHQPGASQGLTVLKRYLGMNMGLKEVVQGRGDMRRFELIPSQEVIFKGEDFRTNSWGMRDQEYEQARALGVCRMMLFGDSHTMGSGLPNGQTYEALLEDKLNEAQPLERCQRFEILNFGVANYSALQSALTAREKVPQFGADVVIYATPQPDMQWMVERLSLALSQGTPVDEPFIQELVEKAGITGDMSKIEISQRLEPVAEALVEWSYRTIAEAAERNGGRGVWVFLPRSDYNQREDQERFRELLPLAQQAGLIPLSLLGAFDGYDPKTLQISVQDTHPNVRASELLAERFYQVLSENWEVLFPPMEVSR